MTVDTDPLGERPSDQGSAMVAVDGDHRAQRSLLGLALAVLSMLLIALVVYLLFFLGTSPVIVEDPPRAGLQALWVSYGPGETEYPTFDGPMGAAVGIRDRLYITDAGHNRVCVLDAHGRFLFAFGTFGVAKPLAGARNTYVPGSLNYPVGIDTDDSGNVYVASFGNDCIEVFDADGVSLRRFPDPTKRVGKGGSGKDGTGIAVTDVAVHDGRVFALDTYQVFVFTLEGDLVRQWGIPGSGETALDHPNGLEIGSDGTVYVSDSNNSRVSAFSPEGARRWSVGTRASGARDLGSRPLQLPRGLALLPDGDLLIADAFDFSLVRISAKGELKEPVGERGTEPGQLNFPNDVAALRDTVVVVDRGNDRIQLVRITTE